MSNQIDDTNPKIATNSIVELYKRSQQLAYQVQTHPNDQSAKSELAQLTAYVNANASIAKEFVRLQNAEMESESSHNSKQMRGEYIGSPIAWEWRGEVIDFWSDLIEGQANQQAAFLDAYRWIIFNRRIRNVVSSPQTLSEGLWIKRKRAFDVFEWYAARSALHTEKIGNDLYISWRVFVAEPISRMRVILWLILCLLISAGGTYVHSINYQAFVFGHAIYFIQLIMVIFVGSLIGISILGLFRHHGDPWALLRRPLDEFDRDDAMAVGHIVHKSVLQAIDAIGIDSMKLAPKEPLSGNSPRSSRRI